MFLRFACLLLVAWIVDASVCRADTGHTFQIWNSATVQSAVKTDSRWTLWGDVHARRGQGATTLILRPGFGLKLMDCLTAHLGYAWVPTFIEGGADRHEHRLWQHFLWRPGFGEPAHLLVRLRSEQRFMKGGDKAGHRLRWMVRTDWSPPRHEAFLLVMWDELFVQLNNTGWGLRKGYDQNRLFSGVGFRTSVGLRVEMGYLAVHLRRLPQNRMQHVLAVNLFY